MGNRFELTNFYLRVEQGIFIVEGFQVFLMAINHSNDVCCPSSLFSHRSLLVVCLDVVCRAL